MADNIDMLKQLYTPLEKNVFYGDVLTQRKFVTIVSPGQFISADLKENSLNDQHTIWNLTNKCLDSTFVHRFLTSSFRDCIQK
jgi:hypothetical protein